MARNPGSLERVLVIGATSTIAEATARRWAERGASLVLVGRNPEKLAAVADDLRVRGGGEVRAVEYDVTDLDGHEALVARCSEMLGHLDAVLIAHGSLPEPKRARRSPQYAASEFATNATSTISLLTALANYFKHRRSGCIAVITSVAGDRGRQSNYLYGASKAAVGTFLEGLRGRLRKSNVAVVDIRPGSVATPMTAHLKQNFLFADPARVGAAIDRAMRKRRPVVYAPWFWRPIMWVIRHTPRAVFDRMEF